MKAGTLSFKLNKCRQIAFVLLPGVLLLLFSFGSLQAQVLDISLLQNKPRVEIPFRSVNNLILVPVLLDGLIPLEFMLDTGVRTSILTDRLYSDVLNISYDRMLSLKGAGQEEAVHAYVASNVRMLLPNVQMQNQSMLVLQEDYLELGSQLGVPVHGILGYELFARFVVKIDYDKNVITLYEPENFKAPRSYSRLDLTVENTKPYVQAEITDKTGKVHKLKFLIDTGASHALLVHTGADKQPISLPPTTIHGSLGRGLLGDIMGHIGRLPRLELGGNAFENVLSSFPEKSSYDLSGQEHTRDGTMGGEVLSRFSVIIDYPHKALYLKKGPAFDRPFVFSKTGITFAVRGPRLEEVEITDVRKGSPAEAAGIKKYDILLKINSIRADGSTLGRIGNLLRRRDGKVISCLILRKEEKIRIKFRLKDII